MSTPQPSVSSTNIEVGTAKLLRIRQNYDQSGNDLITFDQFTVCIPRSAHQLTASSIGKSVRVGMTRTLAAPYIPIARWARLAG